jgi:hypothetical protein
MTNATQPTVTAKAVVTSTEGDLTQGQVDRIYGALPRVFRADDVRRAINTLLGRSLGLSDRRLVDNTVRHLKRVGRISPGYVFQTWEK